MSTTEEIEEALGYDADLTDPRQRCEHGTFIGSWWGPDYLCQWCELGISADEVRAAELEYQAERLARAEERYARLVATLEATIYDGAVLAQLFHFLVNDYVPYTTGVS